MGSLRDREVACSASDRQDSNFESCVWRTVSSQSSHHPQEVILAQFSLYVHKGGLKPDSFHFISFLTPVWSGAYTLHKYTHSVQGLDVSLQKYKLRGLIVTTSSNVNRRQVTSCGETAVSACFIVSYSVRCA